MHNDLNPGATLVKQAWRGPQTECRPCACPFDRISFVTPAGSILESTNKKGIIEFHSLAIHAQIVDLHWEFPHAGQHMLHAAIIACMHGCAAMWLLQQHCRPEHA